MHHRDTEGTELELNRITEQIIGAAIEVHKTVGPGLLESAYEECLLINFNVPVLKEGIRRRIL